MTDSNFYSLFEKPVENLSAYEVSLQLTRLEQDTASPLWQANDPLHAPAVERRIALRQRQQDLAPPPPPPPSREEILAKRREAWIKSKTERPWFEASRGLPAEKLEEAKRIFGALARGKLNFEAMPDALIAAGLEDHEPFLQGLATIDHLRDSGALNVPGDEKGGQRDEQS
jgi:hypothetical protein